MIGEVTGAYITGATEGFPEEWDLDQLWTALGTLYPISLTVEGVESEAGGREGLAREYLQELITDDALAAYARREEELGAPVMRELERRVVLSVLDRKWREHLYEMDYLREGIGLRAYSQRDPLVEYQREGFDLFTAMMDAIAEESVGFLFNLDVQVEAPPEASTPAESVGAQPQLQLQASGLQQRKSAQKLSYSAPAEVGGEAEVRVDTSTPDASELDRQRQVKTKTKNRQKAKQQRKSRKKNR
jgi:preprotein translocase subunit SecA